MGAKTAVRGILLIVAIISLAGDSFGYDYCRIKSCQDHTMCLYKSSGPSSKCTRFQGSGLSDQEKRNIVNLHNQLRRKVASGGEHRGNPGPQPRAKHMPNLVWDNELATIAQRWADQCTWGHDKCRNVERFSVGQNIAVIGTTANVKDIKVESMVNSWYDEVKNYNRNEVSKFRVTAGPVTGHYTQMLWAKTTTIGCGGSKFNDDNKFNKFYLVCNYGPTGNFIGQPVYEVA